MRRAALGDGARFFVPSTACHHGARDDYIKKTRLRELPRAGAQTNTQKRFGRCCRGMAGAGLFFGVCDAYAADGLTCVTMRASCACPAPIVRRQRSGSVIVEASFLAVVCPRGRQT